MEFDFDPLEETITCQLPPGNFDPPVKRDREETNPIDEVVLSKLKSKPLKKTTKYSYLNSFHNFWKWIEEHYEYMSIYKPPESTIGLDLTYFPIRLHLLTPEIIFEYIGANKVSEYSSIAKMFKRSLVVIAETYGMKKECSRLMEKVKANEIKSKTKGIDRKRFVKTPNKKVIIYDDDDDDDLSSEIKSIVYAKFLAYEQWKILESLSPGLFYTPNN